MANNIISEKLEEGAANEELFLKYTPCDNLLEHDIAEARSYAAKLDRLVKAAKEFAARAERQIYPSDKPNSDYARLAELTAALADIELPERE